MDYEQFYSLWSNEIYPTLTDIEMWQVITSLGIKPYKDGNQWCYLYGDDIQSGICGFGNTIKEAAFDFYINLATQILSL